MSTIVKTNAPVLLVVGYFRLTGDSSEQYAPRASCFGIMGNSSNDDSTKSAENAQQKAKEYLKTTWARLCESRSFDSPIERVIATYACMEVKDTKERLTYSRSTRQRLAYSHLIA